MIEYINDHTVRLTPGTKRRTCKRPAKRLNAMEQKIVTMAADALGAAMDGEMWYRRQLGRADRYQKALEKRGCRKIAGLPGYTCPPGAHKVLVEI